MKTLIIGDHHAEKSIKIKEATIRSVNGLPINDKLIPQWLEDWTEWDKIYFSCSYPLAGLRSINSLKLMQHTPPNFRTLDYDKQPNIRGFYKNTNWRKLNQEDYDFLLNNWKEMIEYYTSKYDNLVLFPLASLWFDKMLNFMPLTLPFVKDFQQIDLSPLHQFNPDFFSGEFGNLSDLGWIQLQSQFNQNDNNNE